MSSVFTSVVGTSAALPPSPLGAHIARDYRAIKVASGPSVGAVRPKRAAETQGRHRVCAAVGQGSATSGGNEIRDRNSSRSRSSGSKARRLEYDVVIVGAGIIGLATAHHILFNTNLSVALIDAAEPCAGATGAGQDSFSLIHNFVIDSEPGLLLISGEILFQFPFSSFKAWEHVLLNHRLPHF